jgi:hypothetical protein
MERLKQSGSNISIAAASPDRAHLATVAAGSRSSQATTSEANSGQRRRRKAATASWYGSLLIISALLVAASWELCRLILAIFTLD